MLFRSQVFPEQYGNGKESSSKSEPTAVSFGMEIQPLTDQQLERQGLKQKGGVQVVSVVPGSFAEEIHLAPGDVIVAINRQALNSTEDVTRIRGTFKPGDAVQFRVLRKGPGRSGEWSANYLAGTLSSAVTK